MDFLPKFIDSVLIVFWISVTHPSVSHRLARSGHCLEGVTSTVWGCFIGVFSLCWLRAGSKPVSVLNPLLVRFWAVMSEFLHPSLQLTSKQRAASSHCARTLSTVSWPKRTLRSQVAAITGLSAGPWCVCPTPACLCFRARRGKWPCVLLFSQWLCSWAHCRGRGILGTAGPLLASAVPLRPPPPASPATLTECEAWLVRVLCLNALCFPWT